MTLDAKARRYAKARPPKPPKTQILGGIVAATPAGITGWARDPAAPGVPVKVVLTIGQRPVASGIADRQGLDALTPAQSPGFLFPLPEEAPPYTLQSRTAAGQVFGKPFIVTSPYEGMIDGLREGRLLGWVWSPADPDAAISVDLLDGPTLLARVPANLARDDLKAAGKRSGACGFCFELPSTLLDGQTHSLRVAVTGQRGVLRGGPIAFGPLTLSPMIEELTALRAEVARLTEVAATLQDPRGTFQRGILEALIERVDAYAEIQNNVIMRQLNGHPQAPARAKPVRRTPV